MERTWGGLVLPTPYLEVKFMRRTIRPHAAKRPEPEGAGPVIGSMGEVFKGLGSFLELVSEMEEKGQEKLERTGEIKMPGGKAMYGFSIKTGGLGPTIERFGNIVRETEKGPVVEEMREPFVDIFEEEGGLEVIAELPGVEEEDISCEIKDGVLIVSADGDGRKYKKEVLLPCKASILKTSYRNGIFKLSLKKEEI